MIQFYMDVGDEYLTVSQVAERYQKKPHQIRYAIKTGVVKAIKPNWEVFILTESIPETWKRREGQD